jgi:hypothetical protein
MMSRIGPDGDAVLAVVSSVVALVVAALIWARLFGVM